MSGQSVNERLPLFRQMDFFKVGGLILRRGEAGGGAGGGALRRDEQQPEGQ